MNIKKLLAVTAFLAVSFYVDAQIVTSYEKPSHKELKKAVRNVLHKTTCRAEDMDKRVEAMGVIQRELNNFTTKDWAQYESLTDRKEIACAEKSGAMYFYRKAADKVLKEVRNTRVKQGHVVMWSLYNMGYIVKTPSQTFAIDLRHMHADEFAKHLDFVMITHKHADHGAMREYKALAAAGVPVYAGYMPQSMPEGLVWNFVEDGGEFKVGNVSVKGKRIDHSYKGEGLKLVTAYEVDCGEDAGNAVILHSGDGRNYEQLAPEKSVDFFIFHVSVGLNIQKAIDKIDPEYAVFSHVWEMGHEVLKWRWTIDDATTRMDAIEGRDPSSLLCPCWGEKMVYTKKTGSLSRR